MLTVEARAPEGVPLLACLGSGEPWETAVVATAVASYSLVRITLRQGAGRSVDGSHQEPAVDLALRLLPPPAGAQVEIDGTGLGVLVPLLAACNVLAQPVRSTLWIARTAGWLAPRLSPVPDDAASPFAAAFGGLQRVPLAPASAAPSSPVDPFGWGPTPEPLPLPAWLRERLVIARPPHGAIPPSSAPPALPVSPRTLRGLLEGEGESTLSDLLRRTWDQPQPDWPKGIEAARTSGPWWVFLCSPGSAEGVRAELAKRGFRSAGLECQGLRVIIRGAGVQ